MFDNCKFLRIWMNENIHLLDQIRSPPVRFENYHLNRFAHRTIFLSTICIVTHQYQCEILNYTNPQREILFQW